MADIVGFTNGGMPIYWPSPNPQRRERPLNCRNPRMRCKECGNRTTKRQRKSNGNRCFHCKEKFQS